MEDEHRKWRKYERGTIKMGNTTQFSLLTTPEAKECQKIINNIGLKINL